MCHWRMVDFFCETRNLPQKKIMNLFKITHISHQLWMSKRKRRTSLHNYLSIHYTSIIYLYTIHLLSIYIYLNSIIHSSRGLDISNKLSECYHRESDALFLGWLEKWLLLSRLWTSDTWWPRIFLDINLECPFVLDPLSSIRSLRHLNQNRWSK